MLLLAILCGYVMGIYQRRTDSDDADGAPDSSQDLLKNLGYLLREETDAGLDQFIHRLDVSPATLDTHLAVGGLLRRKGEISRAIRVHQNLISRPSLSKAQQRQAQIELAQDFAQAGLLDRAERLLLELFEIDDAEREKVAQLLVDIYQDEREWERALDIVNQLGKGWFNKLSDHWQTLRAHFHCELAAVAVQGGDLLTVRRILKQARAYQKNLARSYLLEAEVELQAGDSARALAALEALLALDPDSLYAGLPVLQDLAKKEQYLPAVKRLLQQGWRQAGIASFVVMELELEVGRDPEVRKEILEVAIQKSPNLRLLAAYLALLIETNKEVGSVLEPLAAIGEKLNKLPHFKCSQCGFAGKQVHWLCPSCKTWSSLRPIKGLEGV
ncbi:hypothetical protein [Simiduia aestuariiviva]|uniref:hypothetical protein n=1 Tax=Simiduia aestuariiviva TaxID=1510459 RepID=UPI001C85EEA8|nr:hypothetical protein [Simiduia aestuariiviva]